MKLIPILLIFISLPSFAQVLEDIDREVLLKNPRKTNPNINDLDKYPEIYLHQESFLQDRSDATKVGEEPYYTQHDPSALSVGYHFSYDYEDFSKVQSFRTWNTAPVWSSFNLKSHRFASCCSRVDPIWH